MFQRWTSSMANPAPGKLNRSLSYQISQHHSLIVFDELSNSSTLFVSSSIEPSKARVHRSVNASLLFIIICLFMLVHVPYFVLALLDLSALQLSAFIYIHWLGTLFIPLVHLQLRACRLPSWNTDDARRVVPTRRLSSLSQMHAQLLVFSISSIELGCATWYQKDLLIDSSAD